MNNDTFAILLAAVRAGDEGWQDLVNLAWCKLNPDQIQQLEIVSPP